MTNADAGACVARRRSIGALRRRSRGIRCILMEISESVTGVIRRDAVAWRIGCADCGLVLWRCGNVLTAEQKSECEVGPPKSAK